MNKSKRLGYINQAFGVTQRSITGTLTDSPIRGYEELLSLADTNTVKLTFNDLTVVTVTLMKNTHISFNDVSTITTSGDVIVS